MKKIILIFLLYLLSIKIIYAQKKTNSFEGIWVFVPLERSADTSFKSFYIFRNNKILNIFYWTETRSASIYGSPYIYYGFWNTYLEEPQPKRIDDLMKTGKYVFFYDDLVKIDTKIKIGFDSLGNLYKPTRKCQWAINDELPPGLPPTTLTLYFNMKPDTYKKINTIPYFVLNSLKINKEQWQKYLDFMNHKEGKIIQFKVFIHTAPNKKSEIYLLKGDEVEIIEKKDNWFKIRYYGKRTTEGWIKKGDVAW